MLTLDLPPQAEAKIIQASQQAGMTINEVMPVKKSRQAGTLAHLFKDNEDIGSVFLEPMSEEELALWNGNFNDKYGITLSKENGNV